MGKKYYKNLKLIVCVGKDNLIGDRTPDENSNGMLWHIKEELIYFKIKLLGIQFYLEEQLQNMFLLSL